MAPCSGSTSALATGSGIAGRSFEPAVGLGYPTAAILAQPSCGAQPAGCAGCVGWGGGSASSVGPGPNPGQPGAGLSRFIGNTNPWPGILATGVMVSLATACHQGDCRVSFILVLAGCQASTRV